MTLFLKKYIYNVYLVCLWRLFRSYTSSLVLAVSTTLCAIIIKLLSGDLIVIEATINGLLQLEDLHA